MKITTDKPFTYPVLSEGRDDYKTCKFNAGFQLKQTVTALNLDFEFKTDCEEINKLIAYDKAEYLIHLECPTTFFRKTFSTAASNISTQINLSRIKKNLEIVALIVAKRKVKDFFCADWNEDFEGWKFNFEKGNVLAYKVLQTLRLPENIEFAKNESIFLICKKLVDDDRPFEVNLDGDKIKIFLGEKDFKTFTRYAEKNDMQPILNAMVIFPTLVYIFDELREDIQMYESADWFISLCEAYKKHGLNFVSEITDSDKKSIELAQEVMELPITNALKNLSAIYEDGDED